jgi:hypothetical protein
VPDAEYIELFNTHSNAVFDLSGWRFNGVDFHLPVRKLHWAARFSRARQESRCLRERLWTERSGLSANSPPTFNPAARSLSLIKPVAAPAQDIVVDKLRYEGAAPWPELANGTGSSIQLIDAAQENSRPANWFADLHSGGIFSPDHHVRSHQ